MSYQEWVERHKAMTPWDAWRSGVESAVQVVEEYLRAYPESVFFPPPTGQHGNTIDACSASALRAVLPEIIADIKRLTE